jgi:hypothetical protein
MNHILSPEAGWAVFSVTLVAAIAVLFLNAGED